MGRCLRLRALHRRAACGCLAVGRQSDHCRGDPGNVTHHALGCSPHRLQLLGAFGRHGDREIGLAVGDEDIRHEPEVDDIAFHARATHRAQLFEHYFFRDFRHRALSFFCYLLDSRGGALRQCDITEKEGPPPASVSVHPGSPLRRAVALSVATFLGAVFFLVPSGHANRNAGCVPVSDLAEISSNFKKIISTAIHRPAMAYAQFLSNRLQIVQGWSRSPR